MIEIEILKASHQEHLKYSKDLSYILDFDDPKRIKILSEANKMAEKIRELEKIK